MVFVCLLFKYVRVHVYYIVFFPCPCVSVHKRIALMYVSYYDEGLLFENNNFNI